jgi:hypothetical protein
VKPTEPAPPWEHLKTPETRDIEAIFRTDFPRTDVYRYNTASIRVRVIHPRFKGLTFIERVDVVEPWVGQLPIEQQREILCVLCLTPEELESNSDSRLRSLKRDFDTFE